MKPHRRKRLYWILVLLLAAAVAMGLVIYALGQNVNLYFTPSQLVANKPTSDHAFRIGGMVKQHSLVREPNSLTVRFVLTDFQQDVAVQYTGILPTLFREGQGVVVQGKLNANGQFVADQVLAKHDEKYMPPQIKQR
jgi:cytochrome c-type biogenesis protein CcmE